MIIATIGRLGKGKTLSGVIEAYDKYLEGKEVFSNIWLDFPHTAIKTPYDFLELENGFFLADELWHLADNRKSMNLLNDVLTIILIRSRKRSFDVFYTQQFLQIDVRIAFISDQWIKPRTIPDHEICKKLGIAPDILVQEVYDADFNKQDTRTIECKEYVGLYDTNRDPYTLASFITDESLKRVMTRALEEVKPQYEKLTQKVKESGKERLSSLKSLS
jgi:hypothetical protein